MNSSAAPIRPAIRYLLAVSLILNLVALGSLVQVIRGRGGIGYLKAYFLKDQDANIDYAALEKERMFEVLPTPASRPVVFLGDSLTASFEWRDAFGGNVNIVNRAIGGETSAGMLKRVGDVCRLHPIALFLMAGANDPQSLGYSPDDTARNINEMVKAVLAASPDAKIYLESVLASRSPKFNRWGEQANQKLRTLANGTNIAYVDIRPLLLDADQMMDLRYTVDGLHLNEKGYLLWKAKIEPLISELTAGRN